MNRADILAELVRIQALLEASDADLAEARRGLKALGEAIRADPEGCPFEPGRVQLVSLQSRSATTTTKTKAKKKKKKAPKTPAGKPPRPRATGDGAPLTGRIAAMVRDGVPTDEILALYRVKPEHRRAFVDAFVTPARLLEPAATCEAGPVTRCPTPP